MPRVVVKELDDEFNETVIPLRATGRCCKRLANCLTGATQRLPSGDSANSRNADTTPLSTSAY